MPTTTRAFRNIPASRRNSVSTPAPNIDAETDPVQGRQGNRASSGQQPPYASSPGVCLGSVQYRVYREEAYQALNMQLNSMKHQLRDYYEQKRQQFEKERKEMLSATPPPKRRASSPKYRSRRLA